MRPLPPSFADRGILPQAAVTRKGEGAGPHITAQQSPGIAPKGAAGLFFTRSSPIPTEKDQLIRLMAASREFSLPPDKLSVTILRFARHFSLPLESSLLRDIRREALQSRTNREAAALASCASRAKGQLLDQVSLALYAAAIDPGAEHSPDNGGARHGWQEKGGGREPGEEEEGPQSPVQFPALGPTAELLRRMNGATDPSGSRWVVLPFAFSKNGIDFKASLRLLFINMVARRLALDITWHGKRWTVVVDAPTRGAGVATIFSVPTLGKSRAEGCLKNLADLLGPLFSRLEVGLDGTPLADCLEPFPAPVDEEV